MKESLKLGPLTSPKKTLMSVDNEAMQILESTTRQAGKQMGNWDLLWRADPSGLPESIKKMAVQRLKSVKNPWPKISCAAVYMRKRK
jgi:hypothetical protein